MSSPLLRFTDFIKQNIGATYLEIADYFSEEIEQAGSECELDWHASQGRIVWDGTKNKSPRVLGYTSEDSKRSYIWAEECIYTQDKGTFSYPFVSFKNMRNSINQPGRKFHALKHLYEKYEEYKTTRKVPLHIKPKTDLAVLEAQHEQAKIDAQVVKTRQKKVQRLEPKKFSGMIPISKPGVFSPYLQYDKKLQVVAEKFNIRIGKNNHGYFTCFELKNINGKTKALQRIYHDIPQGWEDNKRSTWGVDTTGLMAIFGDLSAASSVTYICEGLATGLSMHLATGKPVVICLYANNMRFVSRELSLYYPTVQRVHVADNDNLSPEHGNTGIHAAAESVKQNGGWVFVPKLLKGTDACDLYNIEGLDELKRQIFESDTQYFNGRFSKNLVGIFNYIHDRYVDKPVLAA